MKKIYVWENVIPNQNSEKKKPVKKFDKNCNITKLLEVTNPIIEVFQPKKDINNGIGVLICPGGAYELLAIDLEEYEATLWLNKLGYTAYVLQYRVPTNKEGAFNDIQRSFKIIRSNFNHTKIGVLGFSAGGSLCARLSTNFSKLSYASIDKIDTLPCRPDFSLLIYSAYLDNGKDNSVSSNLLQDKNICPTFIFGTEDDVHFNSSIAFAKYLKELKVVYELHTLSTGGHGYGLRKGNIAAETWPVLAEKWLNSIIK